MARILAGGMGLQPDVFFHDSATQSSILAEMQKIGGYTAYRRIGSTVRTGATILGFTQRGDDFEYKIPQADISVATPGTSAITQTLATIPVGVAVQANLTIYQVGNGDIVYVSALTQTDQTPVNNASPFGSSGGSTSAGAIGNKMVWTNTSAQVRIRSNDGATTIGGAVNGYKDLRGKDA
jgi:hypothetical protein